MGERGGGGGRGGRGRAEGGGERYRLLPPPAGAGERAVYDGLTAEEKELRSRLNAYMAELDRQVEAGDIDEGDQFDFLEDIPIRLSTGRTMYAQDLYSAIARQLPRGTSPDAIEDLYFGMFD